MPFKVFPYSFSAATPVFSVTLNMIFSLSFAIRFSLLTDHELKFAKVQFLVKWISP